MGLQASKIEKDLGDEFPSGEHYFGCENVSVYRHQMSSEDVDKENWWDDSMVTLVIRIRWSNVYIISCRFAGKWSNIMSRRSRVSRLFTFFHEDLENDRKKYPLSFRSSQVKKDRKWSRDRHIFLVHKFLKKWDQTSSFSYYVCPLFLRSQTDEIRSK